MATVPQEEAVNEVDERTKPPFLRRVRIRGYKSIAFCDVRLQPLTILVGRNAAGKSNFLDALAFLRDAMDYGGLAEALKRRGGIRGILCRSAPTDRVSIEVEAFLRGADNVDHIIQYQIAIQSSKPFPDERPHESLRIRNTATNQMFGFTTHGDRAIFFGKGDLSGTAYNLSPDLFLRIDVNEPDHSFWRLLTNMAFYNFHPDAIRLLQTPNPGKKMEKDGNNLASVIGSLKDFDPGLYQRVRDYLSVIDEKIQSVDVLQYGEQGGG